jgi:tetratricopeptide (TPR) repeat protein
MMARLGRPTPELRYRKAWMLIEFARNYEILGDTGKQRARAVEAHRLLAGLAAEKPNDLTYQRDLGVANEEMGRVFLAQGDLTRALESFRAYLSAVNRLAMADPGNAEWQRDLAISHGRVAMVLARQGEHSRALGAFHQGRDIIIKLKAAAPSNATLPKDLDWFDRQIDALEKR